MGVLREKRFLKQWHWACGDIVITTAPTLFHWNNNNNRNFVSSFSGNIIMLIERKTA